MAQPYRAREVAAGSPVRDLAAERDRVAGQRAYSRRAARAFCGGVAVFAGLGTLVLFSCLNLFHNFGDVFAVTLLTGLVSLLAYGIVRVTAHREARAWLDLPFVPSNDAVADLARFETSRPLRVFQRRAQRAELRSVLCPLLAMSLVLPLPLVGGDADFLLSVVYLVYVLPHVALAACSIFYARLIHRSPSNDLLLRGQRDWSRALVFTTVAAIPGLLRLFMKVGTIGFGGGFLFLGLLYLPTVLLIPAAFNVLRARVVEERAVLARLH